MFILRRYIPILITLLLLSCGGGGGGGEYSGDTGTVYISIGNNLRSAAIKNARTAQATLPGDITSVRVTCSGPGMTEVTGLIPLDGTPLVLEIPAGANRTFTVRAYAGDILRMEGSTTVSYIYPNRETSVVVTLYDIATIEVLPSSVQVQIGTQQQFIANVTAHADKSVTWSVNDVVGGDATYGTIDANGLYTAPDVVPSPATVTIKATSNEDPTLYAEATVTITESPVPISVSVSPSSATLGAGQQQTFTAVVTGTSNTAVTWSVEDIDCGSEAGTIDSSGTYTAGNPSTTCQVTVRATSQADPTKSGTAQVNIVVITVSVSPSSANVAVNQTQQFTATVTGTTNTAVTWYVNDIQGGNSTVGTIDTNGLYTAPSAVPSPATVTVKAVSQEDTTAYGTAQVTVITAGGAGVVSLSETGQTTCYDTAGNIIACAGTGQDGEYQIGVSWPTPRFTDNGDGTITDNLTGLIWLKDANCFGQRTWSQALSDANNLASGSCGLTDGSKAGDWRLPNINELESLVNAEESNNVTWLNTQGFTNVQYGRYWSATTYIGAPNNAWALFAQNGGIVMIDKSLSSYYFYGHYVLPVRAGQQDNPDPNYPANIWKTGQTTCYDTAGNIIACAGTGQDGEYQIGVSWPTPRFTDNGDGTVTDNLTGLIWAKDANAPGPPACTTGVPMPWQSALDYIDCLNTNNYLGYSDWRLPNIKELYSLIDFSQSDPPLPSDYALYFANVQLDDYWSATTATASYTNYAKTVRMLAGKTLSVTKVSYLYVWPVRAGSGVEWLRTYDDTSFGYDEIATSVLTTKDGGYIVGGSMGIMKMDFNGNVRWMKRYPSGSIEDMKQTSDGGYILAGATTSGDDMWIAKVQSDGTVVWERSYGGSGIDMAYSVQQTTDGGYIVAGYTSSFGAGGDDIWVLKLDRNGNVVWEKTYGSVYTDRAYSIVQTTDGGYLVAGYGAFRASYYWDLWVLKLDSSGNITWNKTFIVSDASYSSSKAYSVIETSDGKYVVSGYSETSAKGADIWILKLDTDGTVLWEKLYDTGTYLYRAYIGETQDGGFIIGGGQSPGGSSLGVLLKIQSNGTPEWMEGYSFSSSSYGESLSRAVQTSDGGYIVVGYGDPDGDDNANYMVIKTSSTGEVGTSCSAIGSLSPTVVDTTAQTSAPIVKPSASTATVTDITVPPSDLTPTTSLWCPL